MSPLVDPFPPLALVRQHFPASPPIDIEAEIARGLDAVPFAPGARIAIAAGSRGIADLARVVRAVIATLAKRGAHPFLIPAMGSHGGATPDGQREVLAEYGLTEAALGVPIDASTEAEPIGQADDGTPILCARSALRADGVVLVNRIKPHTDFQGPLGSGLLKMAAVGLGKPAGAAHLHRRAAHVGHERAIRDAARVVLARAPVRAGVALIEDARHALARLAVVAAADFERAEPALLEEARRLMPRLPWDELDLLIVDRLGKNISGAGMDPNVVGRHVDGYSNALDSRPPWRPIIRRIFVRELDPASHGNACGIGMADFTTDRFVRAMDARATFVNVLTSLGLNAAKLPIHFESDREVLGAALASLALSDPRTARVARIADTLSVETLAASETCLVPGLEVVRPAAPLAFDGAGNLLPLGR